MLGFEETYLYSKIWASTPYFTQYYNDDCPHVRSLNFMALHFNPDLENFKLLENYQAILQQELGQDFLRFHWPADEGMYPECFSYLNQQAYQLGKIALLAGSPEKLKLKNCSLPLTFKSLSKENISAYLQANKEADLTDSGPTYAADKQKQYKGFLKRPHIQPVLAYHDDYLLGWLDLVLGPKQTEIHSLYVRPAFRQQGIASALIQQAGRWAQKRQHHLILMADMEDFPYDIYLNQGFQEKSFLIIAEKDK